MEHVGIAVEDLGAAIEFFVALGFELQGEGRVECRWLDRVVGLDGVHGRIELTKFHAPASKGATSTRRRIHRASGISHSP